MRCCRLGVVYSAIVNLLHGEGGMVVRWCGLESKVAHCVEPLESSFTIRTDNSPELFCFCLFPLCLPSTGSGQDAKWSNLPAGRQEVKRSQCSPLLATTRSLKSEGFNEHIRRSLFCEYFSDHRTAQAIASRNLRVLQWAYKRMICAAGHGRFSAAALRVGCHRARMGRSDGAGGQMA